MKQFKINQSVTDRTAIVEKYLHDIGSIPLITPEEEAELAIRIQQGDEGALEKLVEANLRFVVSCAKQYQNSGMDLCDLISEGNVGLIKAARKYDPSRGFKFISYSVWWIRQQILQALSDQGRMVRLPLNRVSIIRKISKARNLFLQENEREPTDEELAELTDIDVANIGDYMADSQRHVSFDMPLGDDSDGTLMDIVPDTGDMKVDDGMQQESLRKDLDVVLMVLTPRERDVIRLAFGLGCEEMTLEEIGAKYDLTRERVRQVKEKAIRKMANPAAKRKLAQYLG